MANQMLETGPGRAARNQRLVSREITVKSRKTEVGRFLLCGRSGKKGNARQSYEQDYSSRSQELVLTICGKRVNDRHTHTQSAVFYPQKDTLNLSQSGWVNDIQTFRGMRGMMQVEGNTHPNQLSPRAHTQERDICISRVQALLQKES